MMSQKFAIKTQEIKCSKIDLVLFFDPIESSTVVQRTSINTKTWKKKSIQKVSQRLILKKKQKCWTLDRNTLEPKTVFMYTKVCALINFFSVGHSTVANRPTTFAKNSFRSGWCHLIQSFFLAVSVSSFIPHKWSEWIKCKYIFEWSGWQMCGAHNSW